MNQVVLVGAGCGRKTITLQAVELLSRCDCVVYDSLLDPQLLELCPPNCEKIFVGKRSGLHSKTQEEINRILLSCGKQYALTVRLKGGDPFVFGRGGEELQALSQAGIAGYAVPGISSCIAAAEMAGIPVTHRGLASGFQVHTAHSAGKEISFTELANTRDTLVFLMAKAAGEKIQQDLLLGGMPPDMPVAVLSQAGQENAAVKRGTLSELEALTRQLPAPLTVLVGKVCGLSLKSSSEDSSQKDLPLVAVTGTPAHVKRVSDALRRRGLLGVECAFSRIHPLEFDGFFAQMDSFSWLVFTSGNGVDRFFGRARELGLDWRRFGNKKFAVIGEYTARQLSRWGFTADLMPQKFTAQALCQELLALHLPKERIALLRAKAGSPVLLQAGIQFSIYETKTDSALLQARAEQILRPDSPLRMITFSSAGGAKALLDHYRLPRGMQAVCIGEETAAELRRHGYSPRVAPKASAQALAEQAAILWEEMKWND